MSTLKNQNQAILANTKLSFLLRACFGISQVRLNNNILKGYRHALREFLESIQHDPDQRALYIELRNTVQVYQALAEAIKKQKMIEEEFNRLTMLGLPPKTIERRLKIEWADKCITEPLTKLSSSIEKAMKSSERLDSFDVAGCNNSLRGLLRQLEASKTKTRKKKVTK